MITKVLVLVGGDSTYHNFEEIGNFLKKIVKEGYCDVFLTEDLDFFLPVNIKEFDIIITYTIKGTLTKAQEEGLLNAIKGNSKETKGRSKGFIGLHGATVSFLDSINYLQMIGGKLLSHPPINSYTFGVTDLSHPITKGITNFCLKDELYLIEIYNPIDTLLTCKYNGLIYPIAWVKPYGLGKVFYLGLGHGKEQLSNKCIQKMIKNAIKWMR